MLPKLKPLKKRVYLDYAATTPVDNQVFLAMRPFFKGDFGNPAGLYEEGRQAKANIDKARASIAQILQGRAQEVIFTAGGTESVNLAIFGVAGTYRKRREIHFISSSIEHYAVLNSLQALGDRGVTTTLVHPDADGTINIETLKKAVKPETIFISLMYANNEVGSILPIAEIGKWLRGLNRQRAKQKLPQIIFHTDASQAAGALDLDVNRLGVDLLSLNGSKIYGPKQTGLLYVRSGVKLEPIIYGGGQEQNLRSGTENVAGIVGLAKALELAQKNRLKENQRLVDLRNYLYQGIKKTIKQVKLNGPELDKKFSEEIKRLPNNLNLSFPGLEGESLMLYLDAYGISVATGSACASLGTEPSHVLQVMGLNKKNLQGSIRITLGKFIAKKDLGYLLKLLPPIVRQLREVRRLE